MLEAGLAVIRLAALRVQMHPHPHLLTPIRHTPHTRLRCVRADFACALASARRQVGSDGRVFTRGAGGGEEVRLVDLMGRLGPDGATRLAALLLAAQPPGLTALDLRCTWAGKRREGLQRHASALRRCIGFVRGQGSGARDVKHRH